MQITFTVITTPSVVVFGNLKYCVVVLVVVTQGFFENATPCMVAICNRELGKYDKCCWSSSVEENSSKF